MDDRSASLPIACGQLRATLFVSCGKRHWTMFSILPGVLIPGIGGNLTSLSITMYGIPVFFFFFFILKNIKKLNYKLIYYNYKFIILIYIYFILFFYLGLFLPCGIGSSRRCLWPSLFLPPCWVSPL